MAENSRGQSSNKMEEEYNWELIMKVSLPVSILVGYVFTPT